MHDAYPQHPTGYDCILCGGTAIMDADGTYLCAPNAISFQWLAQYHRVPQCTQSDRSE